MVGTHQVQETPCLLCGRRRLISGVSESTAKSPAPVMVVLTVGTFRRLRQATELFRETGAVANFARSTDPCTRRDPVR